MESPIETEEIIDHLEELARRHEHERHWLHEAIEALNQRLPSPTRIHVMIGYPVERGTSPMASNVTLRDNEQVLANPTYTDDQGNPASAAANPSGQSDNPALTVTVQPDGSFLIVTTGALVDPATPATVTLTADGISTPATFTVDVVASVATAEGVNFGTPEVRPGG